MVPVPPAPEPHLPFGYWGGPRLLLLATQNLCTSRQRARERPVGWCRLETSHTSGIIDGAAVVTAASILFPIRSGSRAPHLPPGRGLGQAACAQVQA